MSISKERLVIIGKLIGIYREEQRHNTQNEYTQKRFCDGICSPNTLKSIEAGGISRSVDVYVELLGKFGLKFDEYPAIDQAIDELVEELYVAIEYFDRKKIEILTDKALRVLNKVKNVVYYSEIYSLMKNIYDYYIDVIMIEENVAQRYTCFIQSNVIHYIDILRLLVFVREQHLGASNREKYKDTVLKIKLKESKNNLIRMMILHYYFTQNEYFKMTSLITDLEIIFKKEFNYIRLLDVYNFAVLLHSYIEKEQIELYIEKIESLILERSFPHIKISEVYSNIASSLYSNKQYEMALGYYEKMLVYYNNNYITKFIYMADCQNHLNMKIDIPIVEKKFYDKYPRNIRSMYKYFTLDNDTPAFIRQNYIMKIILPTLIDPVYIEVFRYELNKLINVTNHYKNIYLFDKKINENTVES